MAQAGARTPPFPSERRDQGQLRCWVRGMRRPPRNLGARGDIAGGFCIAKPGRPCYPAPVPSGCTPRALTPFFSHRIGRGWPGGSGRSSELSMARWKCGPAPSPARMGRPPSPRQIPRDMWVWSLISSVDSIPGVSPDLASANCRTGPAALGAAVCGSAAATLGGPCASGVSAGGAAAGDGARRLGRTHAAGATLARAGSEATSPRGSSSSWPGSGPTRTVPPHYRHLRCGPWRPLTSGPPFKPSLTATTIVLPESLRAGMEPDLGATPSLSLPPE